MKHICIMLLSLIPSLSFPAELPFHSQSNQDSFLYNHVFKDKKNGVFVDIGANDGITFSNTYFFEKEMGWTGICVEPIPEIFDKLRANRNCHCILGCISNKTGPIDFLVIQDSTYRNDMLSGIFEKFDPRQLAIIQRQIAQGNGTSKIIPVQSYSLTQLLLEHHIPNVDYLSIDTEGGELDILKSIDFSKVDIEIIDVENNFHSPDFQTFLESVGYKKIAILAQDEIYQKST